jgi:hypothetical protein
MKNGADPRAVGLAACAVACVLLAAPQVSAQYTRTEPPKTRFRVGPLRLQPKLELRNAGRDDNVFLDPTNPVADTSVVLRGSFEGFVPVRSRLRLSGEGWLDWSYFRNYSSERSTDPGGTGRAELDIGPLTLVGGGGALQARQLYSIDIDKRTLRQERWIYGGAQWRLTRRWSLSGGGDFRSSRFDGRIGFAGGNPLTARSLNRDTSTGTAIGRYALTPLTTLVAQAELIEDRFAVSVPGNGVTRSYRYLGGLEFGPKALVTGRVLVGLRDVPVASSGSLPSYRGPAVLADVVLPVRGSGRLTGSFLRDVFVSAVPLTSAQERGRNTYVLTSFKGSAEYGLPFDLLARVGAGFDEAKYLLPYTVSSGSIPRIDHLYTVNASLLRGFSDALRIGGVLTYFRRISLLPGQSYDRWTYGVSAELVP